MVGTGEVAPIPRLVELDALRGFALGGILFVNITVMAGPSGFPDGAAAILDEAVFLDKFYVLFSFLFGYSLTLQIRAAQRAGVSARARTVRRCLGLMAIGVAHAVFFFSGDVLFGYGAIGLVLLLFSRVRPKVALRLAVGCYALFVAAFLVLSLLGPPESGAVGGDDRALNALRAGWGAAAQWRWELFTDRLPVLLLFGLVNVLPLFLVGYAAGASRLLEDPARYLRWLPRVQWIGFGVGAPISILTAVTHWTWLTAPSMIAAPLLSAAYAATLLRIIHSWPQVASVFAPAGKIAATTYITQSIIASIIFTGYGFALAGHLSPWTVLGTAAVIYAAQLALASLWVRRHRYGPVEYLLRAITYGPKHLHSPATVEK
ncbi:DUF418 domain-containing protein [Nocardia sp. NPDC050406]|uniref:DUF418 domain-containing protein n=1 Tax=Nocardia sp. NPDC050406 TaxID=3364318 RepID=UPI00379BC7CA